VNLPSADEPLRVEYSIGRIHGDLIFSGITDQPFGIGKGNIAWCRPVALIVGYYLYLPLLPNTYAGVSCTQVNTNGRHCVCVCLLRPNLCFPFSFFAACILKSTSHLLSFYIRSHQTRRCSNLLEILCPSVRILQLANVHLLFSILSIRFQLFIVCPVL
jgi:hypothetical protein